MINMVHRDISVIEKSIPHSFSGVRSQYGTNQDS